TGDKKAPRVQLLGSGTILREVIGGSELLKQDFGVLADVWSCPSFTELRRGGLETERWDNLHPEQPQRKSFVECNLEKRPGAPRPLLPRQQHNENVRRQDPSFRKAWFCGAGRGWLGAQRFPGAAASFF